MKKIGTGSRLVAMLLVTGIGVFIPRTFLTLDEISIYTDGYANQVFYVLSVLASGSDLLDENPLFFVHMVRAAIAVLFQGINTVGGPLLEIVVLSMLVWPVLNLFVGDRRRLLGLLLFFLVFMLSFRGVLVCLAIGYLLLFQLHAPKRRYLLVSFFLGSLSSGAVLLCAILVLRERGALVKRGFAYVLYLVFVLVSLAISAADKLAGFNSGASGYEATVGNSTGIMAAFTRNTIIVSLMSGDYVRAAVYIFILLFLITLFIRSFMNPRALWYRYVLLAGIPCTLLEGLGVIALLVPLLMLAAGIYVHSPAPRLVQQLK